MNLNYFSKVDTVPMDTLVPGRKDLDVIVEEKKTGSFNFGAGFSSIDSLVGFAELQQSNFDLFNWPNFTGAGQRFRIRAQYGLQRQDFTMSLTEPWFMGYKVSVGGEFYYHAATFLSPVYSQSNLGGALQARKALTPFTALRGEYRLENIQIYNLTGNYGEDINNADLIITNPPWDRPPLHQIIQRCSTLAPTWLLFDADWMHTRQAAPFLSMCQEIVSVGRVKWIEGSNMPGKYNCCWYLFDANFRGIPKFYGKQ
jgi:outer membrane protein assembly factor BamA